MGKTLYAFAAKSIQDYILRGGRLKEMVGGSELVSRLCDDFLDRALEVNGGEYQVLGRAAGWARILYDHPESAARFHLSWPLLVDQFAPGLEVVQCMVPVEESVGLAMSSAGRILDQRRNLPAVTLPEAGPMVERSARTGRPAVAFDPLREKEPVGRSSRRKQEISKDRNRLLEKIFGGQVSVQDWPTDLDDIVASDNSYIAVLHADGNSLGQLLVQFHEAVNSCGADPGASFLAFSQTIEETNRQAVNRAYEEVLAPDLHRRKGSQIAARPLVFGGDDLTFLLRADLAINFASAFLKAFEEISSAEFSKRLEPLGIKLERTTLSACAGIAFVKKSHPFSSAYQLAESLCSYAKSEGRAVHADFVPSSLAFHKVTTSIAGDIGEIQREQLSAGDIRTPVQLWMGPYAISDDSNLPSLTGLRNLAEVKNSFPSGSIRSLLDELYENRETAHTSLQRIIQVADSRQEVSGKALKEALQNLTKNHDRPLWNNVGQTPLADALILAAFQPRTNSGREGNDA